MKKTSLYLEPDTDRALARRAEAEGITKAELVRRVLLQAAGGAPRPRPTGCGVFEGPTDLGSEADRYLAETGFGQH